MTHVYEVLRQKELQLSLVRKQIDCLRIVAPLLSEDSDQTTDTGQEEQSEDPISPPQETGTGSSLFSSVGNSRRRFWKIGKRSRE
jgi:hypothetical protein